MKKVVGFAVAEASQTVDNMVVYLPFRAPTISNRPVSRFITPIFVLFWLLPAALADEAAEAGGAKPAASVSAEQIQAWIADLNNPRFVVREDATKSLFAAGPAAIDELGKVAGGDDLESADRAIWILRRLAESKRAQWQADAAGIPEIPNGDLSTENKGLTEAEILAVRRTALEKLADLENRPRLASWANEMLAEIRHPQAIAKITELGGEYLPEGVDDRSGRGLPTRVILDSKWRGGDAGLEHVAELINTPMVQVIGSEITADGIRHLKKMRNLEFIELYGTKITEEEKNKLVVEIPQVKIDYRRGALLGVVGQPDVGPAIIRQVQPDSAAAAAGLHPDDLIESFNDHPVATFQELTDRISECRPGDQAKLGIKRGEEKLTKTVTFGSW